MAVKKKIQVLLPRLGESVHEATILNWLKQEGEAVEMDEPIVEISTDKVDSEVPSPVNGVVVKILKQPDDVVPVGEPIAIIETTDEVEDDIPVIETEGGDGAEAAPAPAPQPAPKEEAVVMESSPAAAPAPAGGNGRFYSPLVLNIARTEGISMEELEKIPGTGRGGRVTKKDMLAYLKTRTAPPAPQPAQPAPAAMPAAPTLPTPTGEPVREGQVFKVPTIIGKTLDVPVFPGDEIVEMDRMRKLIAEHMVLSKHVSPHVTSFVEADMTRVVLWRNKIKKRFEVEEGEKFTFTPVFVWAVVRAIKDFPMINISVAGDKIIKHRRINVGMAVATPSGHLIVPVIHDADMYSLRGLAKKVNDLARRARDGKLKPDEIQGGTFTLTNVGTFGNVLGTPVINQPQVAILATGAIRKVPAVVETPEGDVIAIRHKMFLSHSYDHRVVDGMLGGSFVRRVADYLENFQGDESI